MAVQERAKELFAVADVATEVEVELFCISGDSAPVGIRCREAKELSPAWSMNLRVRISPGRTDGKNNNPKNH